MPVIKNRGLLKNKLQSKKAMNSTSKQRKYEQNTPIEELRVTRKKKSERKERNLNYQPLRKVNKLNDDEKRIRAIRKSLYSIEILMVKQKAGEELDEQQVDKIERLPELLEELESYKEKDHDDDDDE